MGSASPISRSDGEQGPVLTGLQSTARSLIDEKLQPGTVWDLPLHICSFWLNCSDRGRGLRFMDWTRFPFDPRAACTSGVGREHMSGPAARRRCRSPWRSGCREAAARSRPMHQNSASWSDFEPPSRYPSCKDVRVVSLPPIPSGPDHPISPALRHDGICSLRTAGRARISAIRYQYPSRCSLAGMSASSFRICKKPFMPVVFRP